jgi:hypothetical protein
MLAFLRYHGTSSLGVIALFGIDQEQQDKLVQPCIAAIRYAEAACSSGTFEFIHISSSVRVPPEQGNHIQ